jgi:ElaB/YqjD/DUF883 family membrane-anchored ribosome-binding protein
MTNFHLLPDNNRWTLTQEGSNDLIGNFASKEEAIARCAAHMADREGSLKIHGANGAVEEQRTYRMGTEQVERSGDRASGGTVSRVTANLQEKVLNPLMTAARDGATRTADGARRAVTSTDRWIGGHPYSTAGFAFAAGIIAGMMLGKPRRW